MSKSMMIGVAAGVVVTAAAGALATREQPALGPVNTPASAPTFADVVSVSPLTQTVTTPRQVCHQEKVTVHQRPKDNHQIAGTLIGAAVGGLVLNQIGGGVFNALATTAGVIGGGYAGNRIQNATQKGNTKTVVRQRCLTAYDNTTIPDGYQVTYTLKGKTEVVHMDHDPGKQIPLDKDGKLDLNAYGPDRSGQPQGGRSG